MDSSGLSLQPSPPISSMMRVEWSGVESTGLDSPVGVHVDLPSPYNPTGVNWTPVDSSGLQWTPVDSSGLQWTPVDSSGLQWTPVDSSGLHWIPLYYTYYLINR